LIIEAPNLQILARSGSLANNIQGSRREWLGGQRRLIDLGVASERILIKSRVAWKRILS